MLNFTPSIPTPYGLNYVLNFTPQFHRRTGLIFYQCETNIVWAVLKITPPIPTPYGLNYVLNFTPQFHRRTGLIISLSLFPADNVRVV